MGRRRRERGRFPSLDAVVRRRAHVQHVPAVGDEAAQSQGVAGAAAPRTAGRRRQPSLLPAAVRRATETDDAGRLSTRRL